MKKRFQNRKEPQSKRMLVIMLLFLVPLAFILVFAIELIKTSEAEVQTDKVQPEIQFRIDGKLSFHTADDDSISSVSIEIAETPQSREKGLMFRYSVPDTMGMLFIYHEEQYQGYWMKNTHVPLDILYANKNFEIINIYENTKPESEEILPSGDKAKYVIEVAGGFVKRQGIKHGDKFSYRVFKKTERN